MAWTWSRLVTSQGTKMRLAAHGADFLGGLGAGLLVEVDDGHVGSGPGQRHGAAAADAHRRAGHQGLLAGQIEQRQICHKSFPC